ncbi:Ldh family oxidoreductase [Actinophytocola sediminis]
MPRFPASTLRHQISAILRAWRMPARAASRTAEIMVDADLRGVDSHGISMIPSYERKVVDGGLRMDGIPRVANDNGRAGVVIDAGAGLGHAVAADAMDLACDRARSFGVAIVTVRNSHHFGAAGFYARQAAERGLLGLVTTSTSTLVQAPVNGVERRLGTNPLAFAAPGERHGPFVLDMSTTVVAVNKVKAHALAGKDLPAPWVLDRDGRPIHDSPTALDILRNQEHGGLQPLGGEEIATGGHKGYGLAMMVQILSCALSGTALSGAGPADHIGHMFLAVDPAAFGTNTAAHVDDLIDVMHDTTPRAPDTPVMVAGEPEARAYAERTRTGIPLPATLVTQLRACCQRHGVPFLLDDPPRP